MTQARNDDGWYDDDDRSLPPSLGVWPLGRTYVHSSDGALNTGPSANGHGSPSSNGHGAGSRNGRRPAPAAPAPPAQRPGGRPALYPVEGGYRDEPWEADQGPGADRLAVPPFTGPVGDGSTPLYERLALYERYGGPLPAEPAPPRSGRPPLYQVGGRYRGDEWPTDPGFRRGDLGLDDLPDDSAPDLGIGPARRERREHAAPDLGGGTGRPEPGEHSGFGPALGEPEPIYGQLRRDPGYGQSWRDAGQEWQGAGHPGSAAYAGPGSYPPAGHDPRPDAYGDPGPAPRPARHHEPPRPTPAGGWQAGAGETARRPAAAGGWDPGTRESAPRPEPAERRRGPQPVTRIHPDAGDQAPGRQDRETWERNVTPAARVAAVEDAKLLAFIHELIQRLKTVPSMYPRLVFLVLGYAAITSLAFAYAEAIPLPITASLVVIPAAGVIYNMGMRYPDWGRRALVGWISGIVATIIYDCLRLALVKVGIWDDPIPGIGRLVFSDPHANFAWGYFWRFAGNGGGMGIAYAMLPWRGVRSGIAYGTLICTGLAALLFFFPVAQVHFFPLTPVTALGGYAGHWVYGAVLGKLTSWWLPPVELGRIHGRLTARLIHPGHRPRHQRARSAAGAEDLRRAARRSA
jgi:hypothetical protein